jgi:hypothetical protein
VLLSLALGLTSLGMAGPDVEFVERTLEQERF